MNNYALQYLEKVKINGVRNNEENYRKHIAEKSINSKNTKRTLVIMSYFIFIIFYI